MASKGNPGWKKGQSGNPAGCKRGSRQKATILSDAILEEGREEVVRAIVEGAKRLDPACVNVCAKHYQIPRKGRRVAMPVPRIEGAADIPRALGFIADQVSTGFLSAEEAGDFVSLIEAQRRALETCDLAERIARLESAQ